MTFRDKGCRHGAEAASASGLAKNGDSQIIHTARRSADVAIDR
jgi:hypothetical protein